MQLSAHQPLRIELLGQFQIWVGTRTIAAAEWNRGRAAALVKILALAPGHRVHREQLLDLLWPDSTPSAAANSLHQALHVGRGFLAPEDPRRAPYLRIRQEFVSLALETPVWTDVDAFEAAATAALGSNVWGGCAAALQLYRGDLLPDDRYEEWCDERRDSLQQLYLRLLLHASRLAERAGELAEVVSALETVVVRDPLSESANAELMRLYASMGRQKDAIRQFHKLQAVLEEELAVEPEPETLRLFEDIRSGRLAVATRLEGGGRQSTVRGNLPHEIASFVGRMREVAEVQALLASTRLLTLTGAGGCGKTRLAIHVGGKLQSRTPDGVWLVELASIGNPTLVPAVVASALGVPERAERSPFDTLIEHLRDKDLVIILDNCEHLIGACAAWVDAILRACPFVRILATSREPLHIPGEVIWRVSSLQVPDPRRPAPLDDLASVEAVQLFLDRARAVLPEIRLTASNAQTIALICYRLDGIPLAIELAAARVGVFSVEEILTRLDDCFRIPFGSNRAALSRQQTLTTLLDWSYALLSEPEQYVFRRFAVFAGGFALRAAEEVGSGDVLERNDVVAHLGALVDKSLIVAEMHGDARRYRLLEPIRQYASLKLRAAGEAQEAMARHCAWCMRFCEEADAGLWGQEHGAWAARLETEHDNIRAALDRAVQREIDIRAGLRLADHLWQFWLLRGYLTEGRRRLDQLLMQNWEPTSDRASVLLNAAALAVRQGDYRAPSMERCREAYDIYAELNDQEGMCRSLRMLGDYAYVNGQYDGAEAYLLRSRDLARVSSIVAEDAMATHSLGIIAWARGDYERAAELFEECLGTFSALEDGTGAGLSTPFQGAWFLNVPLFDAPYGGHERALTIQEETWVMLRRMGARVALGYTLVHLGCIARCTGSLQRAHTYHQRSAQLFETIGDLAGLSQALNQWGNLCRVEGDFERARVCLRKSLSLRRILGDRRGVGRTLNNLGVLALYAGNAKGAHRLFAASMALFVSMGDVPGIAATRENQGHLALFAGEYGDACEAYTEICNLAREMGPVQREIAFDLRHLGLALWHSGDEERARAALTESRTLSEELGDRANVQCVEDLLHVFHAHVLAAGQVSLL